MQHGDPQQEEDSINCQNYDVSVNMEPSDAQQKEASTTLTTKLSHLSTAKSECSIYKIHHNLRNVNDTAYEPEIVAIGPYHRDKSNIVMMEEHKLRYFQLILKRKQHSVETFVSVIAPLEPEARKCYSEPVSLTPSQLVEMLILDGCFIIELLRKYTMTFLREQNDPIFQMDWIVNNLQRDLILFENQIPFFILCELFDLIEVPNQRNRLVYLVKKFFHSMNPGKRPLESIQETDESSLQGIKHLLGLIHRDWYLSSKNLPVFEDNASNRLRFIASATKLRESNVKFETSNEGTLFDITFDRGSIFLPRLIIEDRTETFIRNIIAYEQYFQDNDLNPLTDYVMLLDCLIDSSRDVEILTRYQIINNLLGEDDALAKVFNRLTESVSGPRKKFMYGKIFNDVNGHCKKRRNRWMANLRHNYLSSPWAILSIVVGIIVILLTLVQTVCSVLQVVLPSQENTKQAPA